MIQYRYNQETVPPAPFVYVTLRCPTTGTLAERVPAQLDTGASRTVLPAAVVEALSLVPLRDVTVEGLGGTRLTLTTYLLAVSVHDLGPFTLEVIAHQDEPFALLGRDILNGLRILLDGPNLSLMLG